MDFLAALVRHLRQPLLIVWDRLPAHRSRLGAGLHCQSAGLDFHRLSAPLRAGTEPGRVHLGLLEATRVAERLPQGLLAIERSCATNATSHASPSASDHRLLAASFFMARMTLYYAGFSRLSDWEWSRRNRKAAIDRSTLLGTNMKNKKAASD